MQEYKEPKIEVDDVTLEKLGLELGVQVETIKQLPPRQLLRSLTKLEIRDRPMARMKFERDSLLNDKGEIPDDAEERALKQLAEIRVKTQRVSREIAGVPIGEALFSVSARAEGPTAGLNANNTGWTELGPGNIGGRTRAIVIDPGDTTRLYAAGVGGGVWRSTDSGASWDPTDDLMANLAVCSLVMDPTDSNTLYAGTGEGFYNADAIRGNGIFVTQDGGNSWNQLAATSANADFFYVNSLAISDDGQTLLAGTMTGIFRSTDAGVSWSSVHNIAIGNIAIDPNNSSNAVAGGLSNGHAYYSTDGGASWSQATRATSNGGRVQLCYASANTSTVYASVNATPAEIWRSTDGGQTYSARNTTSGGQPAAYLGSQGWYDNVIWAGDPTDVDLVIVGGIDLWRSTDGGDTLTPISSWWSDQSAHADHHAIVSDPGYDGVSNRRVYFGDDGGLHVTDDVTTVGNNASAPYTNGWNNLNNGYAVTQFYYGAGHIGSQTIIGGTQDNGTLRYTPAQGPDAWNSVWGGDGGDMASDPSDPQVWYGEYVYLNIFRDTSGGASATFPDDYICGRYWDGFSYQWKAAPYTIPDAQNRRGLFIAPFELDPNEPNRLLAGGESLWRTNDAKTANTDSVGPSWASIKASIGSDISSIAIADGNSDVVLVGHANGNIYRSTDATTTNPQWTQIDTNGINANRQCLCLTIDPDDHNLIYAGFGGFQADNLWRSVDGGASWTDISAGLPDVPIRDITLHPQRSSWVYLATQVGVFASEDGGNSWSPTNEGPANVACRDFFWLGSKLVVATHGRGMFEIDLAIANAFPNPVLEYVSSEDYTVQGNAFTRYRLRVTNYADYPDSLFRASPDLAPCGSNASSSRSWIDIYNGDNNQRLYGFCAFDSADDMTKLWFALPQGTTPPSSVYIVLRDRRCSANYTSNAVTIPTTTPVPVPKCTLTSVLVTLRWWWRGSRNTIEIKGVSSGCKLGARVDIEGPKGRSARILRGVGRVDVNGKFRAYYRGIYAVPGDWRVIIVNPDGSECVRSDFMSAQVKFSWF